MSAGGGVGRGPLLSEGIRGEQDWGGQQEAEQRNQSHPGGAGAAPLPCPVCCVPPQDEG